LAEIERKEEKKIQKTNIEWVRNPDGSSGYTFNPITGCLNHDNGMCKGGNFPCYAYRLAHGRLKQRYWQNDNLAPYPKDLKNYSLDPFYPRFWNNRLLDARDELCNAKPRGIFICDMSDLFGIGIPEAWTRKVMDIIKDRPQHRFYLLTKQPQNLPQWSPYPENCWVGVTATNAKMAEEAGFWLWEVKAKVKFVSFEPLLERIPVHFADYISEDVEGINWVIIGAQTKPTVYPRIEWVQEIVEAADKAGIPVFLKDNLKPLLDKEGCPQWAFEKPFDWEIHRRVRQEIPHD